MKASGHRYQDIPYLCDEAAELFTKPDVYVLEIWAIIGVWLPFVNTSNRKAQAFNYMCGAMKSVKVLRIEGYSRTYPLIALKRIRFHPECFTVWRINLEDCLSSSQKLNAVSRLVEVRAKNSKAELFLLFSFSSLAKMCCSAVFQAFKWGPC